jgi:hypothetical protein
LFLGAAGSIVYDFLASDRALQNALAEADRLDPGWSFPELEAARAVIPDAENAALRVLAARQLLPLRPWLPFLTRPWNEGSLGDLPPPALLDEEQAPTLRTELEQVAAALALARQVAELPRGRYTVAWASDYVGTLLPHVDAAGMVARLLSLDALLRAHDGAQEEALVSCRAALNTGRSLGDEPTVGSQLTRTRLVGLALRTLERVLAQGEGPAAALEAVQRLLETESEEPLALIAARAERAGVHAHLYVVRTGAFNRAAYGLRSSALGPQVDDVLDRARARASHGAFLRYLTEWVEIAKLPPEQQHDRLQQLGKADLELPVLLASMTEGGDCRRTAASFHLALAQLRCGLTAVAVERYRLEHGRWPDTLAALVPRFLGAVPADPYDGASLRFRRLHNGVVIYALGPDRKDDGGHLDRDSPKAPGTDLGFQLWDVEHRRQPVREN